MNTQPKAMTVVGWVLTILVSGLFIFSAVMKFLAPPAVAEQFVDKFGYTKGVILPIGIVEIACVLIFLIPRTAVLGAVLLTGYLGGAIATHVRVNDPFIPPAIAGVVVWLALFLRYAGVRSLLPFRSSASSMSPSKP